MLVQNFAVALFSISVWNFGGKWEGQGKETLMEGFSFLMFGKKLLLESSIQFS